MQTTATFSLARSALLLSSYALIIAMLHGCAGALVAGGAGAAATTDRRGAGTVVSDRALEFKVTNAIYDDKELSELAHINITSYNNVILLTGEAPTEALRNRAAEQARNVANVRLVYNEVAVMPPTSTKVQSRDSWITTKIKTRLIGNEGAGGRRIKVVTERNVVYLLGLVTRTEAAKATELARTVDGVEQVVTLFELQD